MFRRKMTDVDVKAGIANILKRIDVAYEQRVKKVPSPKPTLVAVSKTKPIELIIDAYSTGQRHFGENYVQELEEKSQNPKILEQCPDIKWHFIGNLQRNKVNKVLKLPNLYMIETVDSEKLAQILNSSWEKLASNKGSNLRILIQVNTSREEAKNGVPPDEVSVLFRNIRENCKNLQLEGLMTIGAIGHDYTCGPNLDFVSLINIHKSICEENSLKSEELQISMGMSDDFEEAIKMGSTIVRVGSSIFGYRAKKRT